MGKNKLVKFARNLEFGNVIQPTTAEALNRDHPLKGAWHKEFGNKNPIVLELACGKGEYTTGQAALFPDKNFIGIDIKGARIFSGAQIAKTEGLTNVRFLRTRIDLILSFFAPNEVDEIWITFADPQMEKPRKRLTSALFLSRYVQFLRPEGTLHLKTDSDDLYLYTRDESIPTFNTSSTGAAWTMEFNTEDLYNEGLPSLSPVMQPVLNIRTYYEQRWLAEGKRIKYVRYRLETRDK
jgi:tRNA (guanine-N7-)-methyltransferase